MKGRMEGSEMDTGGSAGTHPFLALSLPPISAFSPFKLLPSCLPFHLCASIISIALIQNTVLFVCGTQPDGSLWEGGRRSGVAKSL